MKDCQTVNKLLLNVKIGDEHFLQSITRMLLRIAWTVI